jgi:hypothetical protein
LPSPITTSGILRRDRSSASYGFSARGKYAIVKYLAVVVAAADCLVAIKGTMNLTVSLYRR